MNDTSEVKTGIGIVKEYLRKVEVSEEKLESIAFNPRALKAFIACFSLGKDELALWNYYTKDVYNDGVNIGFDYRKLIDSIIRNNAFLDGCHISCGVVDYALADTSNYISRTFDRVKAELASICEFKPEDKDKLQVVRFDGMQNTFVTAYAEVLFYIKKVCFRHEQEFRIVIEIPEKKWNAILKNKEVCKIRVFNNIFVPYLDASIDLQAITGCTIAPAVKNDLAADSLKQFCNYVGLNPEAFTEGIAVSSIPVRF